MQYGSIGFEESGAVFEDEKKKEVEAYFNKKYYIIPFQF